MGIRVRRNGWVAASAALLLLLVPAWSGGNGTRAGLVSAAAVGPTVGGAPTLPAIDLAGRPSWSADPGVVNQAQDVQVVGDSDVVAGSSGPGVSADRIAVLDTATG